MTRFVAFSLCLFLAACGDEDPATIDGGPGTIDGAPSADAIPVAERYLPITEGATWTWQVTSSAGAVHIKTSTVGALEDVGGAKAGTMGYKVTTSSSADQDTTVSWQEAAPSAILRHREQSFEAGQMVSDQVFTPYKLRLDERGDRLVKGATWRETYTEVETNPATGMSVSLAKVEDWVVEEVDVPVVGADGVTYSCIQVKRVGEDEGDAQKTYWFARGIGKVKESGKQTELLMTHSVP
jgi:hypothetical protein